MVVPAQIRNLVLMAHGGAGKTSLAESLAFAAGAIDRQGRVEDGNTVADFDPDEQKRGMSVKLAIVSFEHKHTQINLIDTPGYADFVGEVIAGASAADVALITVDATSGVQVGTETAWRIAEQRAMPRLLAVSRMDRENSNWAAAVSTIRKTLGPQCTPLQLPIGEAHNLAGVIDVLRGEAYLGDTDKGTAVPDEHAEALAAAREALIERIAEADDDLTLKYLEGEPLTEAEINSGLKTAIAAGTLVPILASAATGNIGTQGLLRLIHEHVPSPADIAPAMGECDGTPVELASDPSANTAALIFKTNADEFVGRLTYFRVFTGTVKADTPLWNAQQGESERPSNLARVLGKDRHNVAELTAGEIGSVTKLGLSRTFETLCDKAAPVQLAAPSLPAPVFSAAIEPKSKADVDKLGPSLQRLTEEDLTLRIERDADTGQTILSGLGESHVELAADKLRGKFKVDVVVKDRRIPYRETITSKAEAEYLHKKQTGGHGQYARVALRVEPLGRGEGFEFDDKIVGGSVPRNYIPAVAKGVTEALTTGVVARYPLTDIKVTLYDGKHHDVDSSDMAFKLAGSQALKEASQKARPILLEPILGIRIAVPDTATGDVMSDLNSRRARVLGMEPASEGHTTIVAEGPMAEFRRYATELRSITGGRGTFNSTFERYDPVPDHVSKKVVDAAEEESANLH